MTETEFLHETDALFAHIEDALDEGGWDADCLQSGNVLTIEASDGRQVVVNRHTPNRELWIASKLGGHHFAKRDGRWLAAKDGSEFFAVLNAALSDACGETVTVPPYKSCHQTTVPKLF